MPSNLKSLLEIESKKAGCSVASLVIQACWSLLEPEPIAPAYEKPQDVTLD
jgi:hypothetical protein